MSRIAGGLGGTRHYPISMKGLAPHKRGRRPKPVHSSPDTLSLPASGGYEWPRGPRLCQPGRASTEVTGVKGEGYGSNRSREGPHTSSPRGRPAERGRRRAGAPRLARSKGPAGQRHDDARGQVANSIPPRPRPHGLNPAEPGCGIQLPTMDGGRPTTWLRWRARSRACNPKEKPRRGRGSSERKTPPRAGLKYWDERTQRVVEL